MLRVIDLETTGTDPALDDIIEIASVDLVRGGGITNAMQTFVACDKSIPSEISAVHHILSEDLVGAPALPEAAAQFIGADVAIAHNAQFERSFFEANGINVSSQWICTYRCALRVWPDLASHKNQALRYHLNHVRPFDFPRESISPHRAQSDVIVTAAIMFDLMKAATFKQLQQWSNEPALFTRLTFGKHKGARYDEAPPDYLDWIVTKSDMDADTKFSARHWLQQRRAAVRPPATEAAE